jgi:hypothetical protein
VWSKEEVFWVWIEKVWFLREERKILCRERKKKCEKGWIFLKERRNNNLGSFINFILWLIVTIFLSLSKWKLFWLSIFFTYFAM